MSSGCGCGCESAVRSCQTEFQYAVKIVSGLVNPPSPTVPVPQVAPGYYYTAINIHNPAKCGCVTFRAKIAEALPWENVDSQIGKVSGFTSLKLCADQALEIDNGVILGKQAFKKGYLVIESPAELDVVAVYTVAQTASSPCQNLYTERVPARCVPVCEDLVLPISTGVAAWQTVSAPSVSSPGPVVNLSGLNSNWSAAPAGSVWVSASAADSNTAPAGNYTYQLAFELCSGFSNPILQVSGLADNSATITLNPPTNPAFVTSMNFTTVTSGTAPAGQFQVGTNVLQVIVTNSPGGTPNPTGFAISGLLRVAGGRCPCSSLPLLST